MTSEDDSTPLHNAAKKGDESAMEHLLQQVDFKSNSTMYRDNADETPYDIAWKKGHEGVSVNYRKIITLLGIRMRIMPHAS